MEIKMIKRSFIFLILLGFLLPVFPAPVQAQPSQFVSTENAFGYTVDDTLTFGGYWEDISTTGIPVGYDDSQTQLDDAFSDLIPLGFNFPFFENTYTQVYVSTNGFLTFDFYREENYSTNLIIPRDFAPNNIIAPFWDDLVVNTTNMSGNWVWEVYYKQEGNQTRIQWNKVLREAEKESTKFNSFQVILTNSGEIYFVYENLSSSILNEATVGIEGPDGIDGVEYLYHQDGLTSNSVIKFTYPAPGVHLKMKPLYQSAFLENHETIFDLTIVNTGTIESPFNLEKILDEGQDWTVQFFDENLNLLTDTTGDGIVDTGTVRAGNSKLIKVKISSPENSSIGEFCKITVRATSTSTEDDTRRFDVSLQTTTAAPFLQGLNDSAAGVIAQVTTPERQFDQDVNHYFTGQSLSLAAVNDQRYLYAWEELKNSNINIQYSLFNTTSSSSPNIIEIEDNTDKPNIVWDSSPMIAAKYGGQIAITFIRDQYTPGYVKIDSNLFYLWLDQQGNQLISPRNVSQNNNPQSTMKEPSVAVNTNGYAFLAWIIRNKVSTDVNFTDLAIAVYDQNGGVIHAAEKITNSESDNLIYSNPRVSALSSNKFLLTYYVYDSVSKEDRIRYQIFNQDGSGLDDNPETIINNSYGYGQDVVQLPGGNILVAWTNTNSNRIAYVMLNAEGDLLSGSPVDLDSPDNRQMGSVSVTYDEFGHGILTWGDEDWSDYLYYALLDGAGSVITPPMRFRKGLDVTNPNISSSGSGQGNAPIIGDLQWTINLPLLTR